MFQRTTAINKILAMKARKKVVRGGSSAGKTLAILPILIDKCCKRPGLEVSVVSESVPHLKKGALKDFIKIMKWTNRWNESRYNATERKYTFANGSYMEFFSPESVLGSRRNILYINEANNIKYEDYLQLAIRTSDDIYLDYNPASEFWADTHVLTEPDSELLVLTYLDNEARPKNVDYDFEIIRQKAEAEKAKGLPITSYFQNYYRVYVQGLIGNVQGIIFNNWELCDIPPLDAPLVAYGLDFGFSNDPAAIVAVYKKDKTIWVQELLYKTGLTNSDLIHQMALIGISKHIPIVADSAEPKSIEDLRRAGYKIEAAKKGEDSVRNSIDTLQSFNIYVTDDSINLIKELRSYKWLTNISGESTGEPCDYMNHLIDGMRYVALNKLKSIPYRVY